jgi:hypothetical protein
MAKEENDKIKLIQDLEKTKQNTQILKVHFSYLTP